MLISTTIDEVLRRLAVGCSTAHELYKEIEAHLVLTTHIYSLAPIAKL